MKKRILALLLTVFSCMMILGGCGSTESKKTAFKYDPQQLLSQGEQFVQQLWTIPDFTALKEDASTSEEIKSSVESFETVKEEVGDLVKVTDGKITDDGETASVTETIKCKNGIAYISLVFDKKGNMTSFGSERYQTMAEKLELAGINTILAMAFIFIVLIFISFIISLIPRLTSVFEKKSKEEPAIASAPAVSAPAPVAEPVGEVADDGEIAAVIAAAIRAYEEENNVSADGLVVRSIRRHNVSGWKRAQ